MSHPIQSAEQALDLVRAKHPRLVRGNWKAAPAPGEPGVWRVTYEYPGRRELRVEVYVRNDGTAEDIDGNPYPPKKK